MKIRSGFVSNSSSSSFICAVSGGVESGWDAGLDEFDMSQCPSGHEFYNKYLVEVFPELVVQEKIKQAKEYLLEVTQNEYFIKERPEQVTMAIEILSLFDSKLTDDWLAMCDDEFNIFEEDEYGMVTNAECPICTMKHIKQKDLLKYVVNENKLNKETLEKEIRERYKNYDEFREEQYPTRKKSKSS